MDLILNSEEFQEDLNEIYSTCHAYRHPIHPPSPSPPENQDHPHNDDEENSENNKQNNNTM